MEETVYSPMLIKWLRLYITDSMEYIETSLYSLSQERELGEDTEQELEALIKLFLEFLQEEDPGLKPIKEQIINEEGMGPRLKTVLDWYASKQLVQSRESVLNH